MGSERLALIAGLIAKLGKIDGRKRLQKIIHLLQARGYEEFSYCFDLHYYGPFSRELADELDFLCQANLIIESKENDTFHYSLNKKLNRLGTPKNPELKLSPWDSFAKALNKHETGFLEAASTIAFLEKTGCRTSSQLRSKFNQLKPKLSHLFPEASQFVKDNKLGYIG